MVSILVFQTEVPGSIPGRRKYSYLLYLKIFLYVFAGWIITLAVGGTSALITAQGILLLVN